MAIFNIDFDGTLASHKYPDIGKEVPHAFKVLKLLQENGHKLILWTCRFDGGNDSKYDGNKLTEAIEWCKERGITFYGHNVNPDQSSWSLSPKSYAHMTIDDSAFGCPLMISADSNRPIVDWLEVESQLRIMGYIK